MPHLSITVSLALTLVDLGVLIYFIHHIAITIQLPQVIASIARDLGAGHRRRVARRRRRALGRRRPSVAELLRG